MLLITRVDRSIDVLYICQDVLTMRGDEGCYLSTLVSFLNLHYFSLAFTGFGSVSVWRNAALTWVTPPLYLMARITTCHENGNSNLNQPPSVSGAINLDLHILHNVFGTKIFPKWWFDGDLSWYKEKKRPYCKQIQGLVSGRVSSKIPPLVHARIRNVAPHQFEPRSARFRPHEIDFTSREMCIATRDTNLCRKKKGPSGISTRKYMMMWSIYIYCLSIICRNSSYNLSKEPIIIYKKQDDYSQKARASSCSRKYTIYIYT